MSPGGDLTGRQPRALATAMVLLEEIAHAGAGVTAAEIAAATGVPRATAYRLLHELVAQEYVVRLPDLQGFAVGARTAGLVDAAAPARVSPAVRAEVAALRTGVRAAVHLLLVRGTASRPLVRFADVDPDAGVPLPERVLNRHLRTSTVGAVLGPGPTVAEGPEPLVPGCSWLAVAVAGAPVDRAGPGATTLPSGVLLVVSPTRSAVPLAAYLLRVAGCAEVLGPLLA